MKNCAAVICYLINKNSIFLLINSSDAFTRSLVSLHHRRSAQWRHRSMDTQEPSLCFNHDNEDGPIKIMDVIQSFRICIILIMLVLMPGGKSKAKQHKGGIRNDEFIGNLKIAKNQEKTKGAVWKRWRCKMLEERWAFLTSKTLWLSILSNHESRVFVL